MLCVQSRKQIASEHRMNVNTLANKREKRPVLKLDYVRKITADAFMVGSLPTPQSSKIPPGIIRPMDSHNCTYTTNSGFSGLRTYPYFDYGASKLETIQTKYSEMEVVNVEPWKDTTVDHRRSRPPSKHPVHCCACASTASTIIYTVQSETPTQRQSSSVAPMPRQHSQVHVRQASVGATKEVPNGVVLRQHSHQFIPHSHSHYHHLSRRDRAHLGTSMLVTPQSVCPTQQRPTIYHPHFYRQSIPPVVGAPHQKFQAVPPVYASMNIQ